MHHSYSLGSVVVLCAFVPEVRDEDAKGRLDWAGAACTIIGLAELTYALIEWPSTHRHVALTLIALGGLIALAALSFVEQRAESPMIPFGLFGSRNFTGANLLTLLVYAPLGALLFFFPQDLIQIQLIADCDDEVQRHLTQFASKADPKEKPLPRARKVSSSKVYSSQPDYDLRTEHYRILGVDLTDVPGINTLLV